MKNKPKVVRVVDVTGPEPIVYEGRKSELLALCDEEGFLPDDQRFVKFMDDTWLLVNGNPCRGCLMVEHREFMDDLYRPVYLEGGVTVTQDCEWPVPGFYIVSIQDHVGKINDIDSDQFANMMKTVQVVRDIMERELEIEQVLIIHEEKLDRPHVHFWLVPVWPETVQEIGAAPRVYKGTVMPYIKSFTFEGNRDEILRCNKIMGEQLAIAAPVPNLQTAGMRASR